MHEKLFESIFIKLEVRNESIICETIFRSPSHDTGLNQIFTDNLKEILESIKTNHKCFIFGNVNYNLLQHDNNMVNDLLGSMSDSLIYSLINKPTRITNTCATIFNHVRTNLHSNDIKAGVLLHPISDHFPEPTPYYTNQIKPKLDNKIRIFDQLNIEKFQ